MKIIEGILFLRRPASQACPKGAWYSPRYEARPGSDGWRVMETGVPIPIVFPTSARALRVISQLEHIADAREAKP